MSSLDKDRLEHTLSILNKLEPCYVSDKYQEVLEAADNILKDDPKAFSTFGVGWVNER